MVDAKPSVVEHCEMPVYDTIPQKLEKVLKALANDSRLAIVITLLENGEMSVTELFVALKIPFNNLQYHLKVLTRAGLVANYYTKKPHTQDYSFYVASELAKYSLDKLLELAIWVKV